MEDYKKKSVVDGDKEIVFFQKQLKPANVFII